MKLNLIYCLLAIELAALLGCKPASEKGANVLAEVNGQAVTEETFRYWWQRDLRASDTPQAREALLQQLVDRSILVQKAAAEGLDRDPQIVESIESLLIARIKERQLQPAIEAITVTEEEARSFYEVHRVEKYSDPERIHVAVLWFETRGQEPLVARYQPRLERARNQITGAPDIASGFGTLAIENSEHSSSRYKGGDLGWLSSTGESDDWRKAVAEIGASLKAPGDVSAVVARKEGLFVVRLLERRPAQFREFAAVQNEIHRHLRNEKRVHLEEQFMAELKRPALVREHRDQLTALTGLSISTNSVAVSKSNQTTFRPQL